MSDNVWFGSHSTINVFPASTFITTFCCVLAIFIYVLFFTAGLAVKDFNVLVEVSALPFSFSLNAKFLPVVLSKAS